MISFLLVVMIGLVKYIWKQRKEMLMTQVDELKLWNASIQKEVGELQRSSTELAVDTRNLTKALEDLKSWLTSVNKNQNALAKEVAGIVGREDKDD